MKLLRMTSGVWLVMRPWPSISLERRWEVSRNAAVGPNGRWMTISLQAGGQASS